MRDKIFTIFTACLQFAIRKAVEDKEEVAVQEKVVVVGKKRSSGGWFGRTLLNVEIGAPHNKCAALKWTAFKYANTNL